MKTVGTEKVLESGDKSCCQGKTYTIDKIVSWDYYGEQDKECLCSWGFFCEFYAKEDNLYHYWKQKDDGGYVIPKT